ncbi:MAG: HAD-IA family hydrolase [Candidatus Tectomicrobia bacterium]|nr:HAD-IA family hydrolase [Candidatus Tectomicrobia bacterium]
MRVYDAVFLDVGGTLVYPYPSVGEIYASIGRKFGAKASPEIVERSFRQAWKLLQSEQDAKTDLKYGTNEVESKIWWRQVVEETFRLAGGIQDIEGCFEELYQIFAEPRVWRIFPEVIDVLDQLRGNGCVVGIISNWDHRLPGILEGLGLHRYFDHIVISSQIGWEKPAPEIFQKALEMSNVAPQKALHVGDSLRDDVGGAKGVGMDALLIERREKSQEERVIQSLNELFLYIEQ